MNSASAPRRRTIATVGQGTFVLSIVLCLLALGALLYNVANQAAGLIMVKYEVDPASLSSLPLDELAAPELERILRERVSPGVIRRLESETPLAARPQEDLLRLVVDRVVNEELVKTYSLRDSLFARASIEREVAAADPQARLVWNSWLTPRFISSALSPTPLESGVRTAVMGSLLMIVLTLVIAVPIGVGAAIYLEEYAGRSRISQIIQLNIGNLAGVPSIIYGMLGLAIFVRGMEDFTSGRVFGLTDTNGRTLMSAALTMALLVLPLIIINAQEAIRAVPTSLRQASYGLGATKLQTIRAHVLPYAMPGILTGTILAVSRALGETAPLIVIGASTYITQDPSGPFSKFTVLPVLIYTWTARPEEGFRNAAAAAIVLLLVVLIALNLTAILLRNRFAGRFRSNT